jgi:hypothetical protein
LAAHHTFAYSNRVYSRRIALAQALSISNPSRLLPPTDRVYLDALAVKLAEQYSLPLPLARRRVADLAITAKPRQRSDGGFLSR